MAQPMSNPFGAPAGGGGGSGDGFFQSNFQQPTSGFGGQPAAVPMQQMDSGGGGGGGFNASPYAPPGGQMGTASSVDGTSTVAGFNGNDYDVNDEPPILEELGIDPQAIARRTKAVLMFSAVDRELIQDCDMSGPPLICLLLATLLLFAGKVHFGYIYGLGVVGFLGNYMLLNAMSQKADIDLYSTTSILGYGLLPIAVLAFFGVFMSLQSTFGSILACACVFWSTATASRFFEAALDMQRQRWLVAYPVGLVYCVFALITVF